MSSKPIYTTSCSIRCPSCSKSMMLKNFKDHCRQMHTMLPSMIDEKYNEMKRHIENSRVTTATATRDATTVIDKPSPMPINNLFSMKKFALTKTVDLNPEIMNTNDQANQLQSIELTTQEASNNSANPADNSSHHESPNTSISRPPVHEITSYAHETSTPEQSILDESLVNPSLLKHTSNQSNSEVTSDDENLSESEVSLTPVSMKNMVNTASARSLIVFKHIVGVKFIATNEIDFVDAQMKKFPNIQWFTEDEQERAKPSRQWFLNDYPWLRAVFSGNKYGLLCADCIEFARDETLIQRNNGAFIVRPYWKLKHKGLSENQTRKYLSALLQTFWFLLKEELALGKFKSFIKLIHKLECPSILEWFNLSNVKQRYWSREATSELLISINNYINHQQISSLKKTDFINLIINETKDISVKQMICICLRYVEKDSGAIKEETFKLAPVHDVSGEGIFYVVEEFINNLQKQVGKEFIVTAQTYDGAAAMRFQAQGHVRSRIWAWAIYVYCHSHLLNLSIKDSIEYSFYDSFDTIKSALVFLRDSPHRLDILINSQKVVHSK
ncbi:unnamed protein product [Adineta steineri]|uniref:Uncharacterized protein n=1 Tax=Adineta steineri TaxID=433720 RepID=A0A820AC72_9BILA|nr:unnamed protein product [Adineta steineri]CAF4190787.1 unnamed protein product [Adineta steineri]